MKSRLPKISMSLALIFMIIMIVSQSCDSTVNIDEPQRFYKLIGTDGDQFGKDLVGDANDNIYILGTSTSASDGIQLYVVKTNPKGEVLWEKTLGDAGDEQAKDIELTNSGDLMILADHAASGGGAKNYVIYRLRATDGSVIGTPTVGDPSPIPVYANTITEISDGFIVSAYTDNGNYKEASVFRYDATMTKAPNWDVEISQTATNGVGGFDFIPIKVVQVSTNLFYTFCYTNTKLSGDGIADYNFWIYVSSELNGSVNTFPIPGPDPNSNEILTSVRAVPVQSGGGFILGGYISTPPNNQQELYALRVVQDLEFVTPSDPATFLQGSPRTITQGLSSITLSNASVFPSSGSGFLVLGDQNSTGNNNIYLTKVDNSLADAWPAPHTSFSFGGDGNDTPGAVIETTGERILFCGTMVLGNAVGQKKIVLMNLSPIGMFDE